MDIVRLMQQWAGKWPEGKGLIRKSFDWNKIIGDMKGHTMAASADQHWVPDRNGLVQQGLIGDHMVRVTSEPMTATHVRAGTVPAYRVTIGLFHKYGNTSMNPRHREWTSRHRFSCAYKAWAYGEKLVKGATQEGQNRR